MICSHAIGPLRLSPTRRGRRGVAIFMGLATLMLLLAMSVPFVLTTQFQNASSIAYNNRVRARMGAQSALDHGIAMLTNNARGKQFGNWATIQRDTLRTQPDVPYQGYNDPFVDALDEFGYDIAGDIELDYPGLSEAGTGVRPGGFRANDDRAQVWSTRIIDEQGRVNLNTAPPALIGNLLGSGVIANTEGTPASMTITLADGAENFPQGPGHFVVNGVLVSYIRKLGSSFTGCKLAASYKRNLISGQNSPPPIFLEDIDIAEQMVQEGALVIPVAAWMIAWQRLLLTFDEQYPGSYSTVDQMRTVANLSLLNDDPYSSAVDPARWMAAREHFTVHSTGPAGNGFYFPQLSRQLLGHVRDDRDRIQSVEISPADVPNPDWLVSGDPRASRRGLLPGAQVRLRYGRGKGNAEYRQAMAVAALGNGMIQLSSLFPLESAQGFDNQPVIEVREITPINVNTASFEVLVANLKGLRRGSTVVGRAEAESVASAIRHLMRDQDTGVRPEQYRKLHQELLPSFLADLPAGKLMWGRLRNNGEFFRFLSLLVECEVIEGPIAGVIASQIQAPLDMSSQSYAPWCYHSYGAWRIDGVATTYAPVGVDTARSHMRSTILAGTHQPFEYEWRDQHILEANMARPQGNIFALYTGESAGRRDFGTIRLPVLLDPHASFAQGPTDIRLGGGRSYRPAGRGNFLIEPFEFTDGLGVAREGAWLAAGTMSFWHRWDQGVQFAGRDQYIFDFGERIGTNQMSLMWWENGPFEGKLAAQRPGLVFRVADRTLEPAFTVTRMRPDPDDYRPGEWYHYGLHWNGVDPGGVAMTVDGLARLGRRGAANSQFQPYAESDQIVRRSDGRWVSRTARLATDVPPSLGDNTSDTIRVDTTTAGIWPPRGVIKIGDEAIEYTILSADGFAGLSRGARGTQRPDIEFPDGGNYRRGQRVSVWGYSTHVVPDETAPRVPRGGANLSAQLWGNGIYPVGLGSPSAPAGNYHAPSLVGPGTGAAKETGIIPIPLDQGVPELGLWYIRGPAWTGYEPAQEDPSILIPIGSRLQGVAAGDPILTITNVEAEYVLCRRVSNGLQILQRWNENFLPKEDPANHLTFMGGPIAVRDANGAAWPIPGQRVQTFSYRMSGSIAILCSILPSVDGEYLDPVSFPWSGGGSNPSTTARVQIGQGEVSADYEWIEYSRILHAEGARLLAFTVSSQLESRAFMASNQINNDNNANDPSSSRQAIMGMIASPHREFNERANPGSDFHVSGSTPFHVHTVGRPVTPVFAVRGRVAGEGDPVTVLETPNVGAGGGIITRASQQWVNMFPGTLSPPHYSTLIGINAHLGRAFEAATTSEVLKFPSRADALPIGIPQNITFGGSQLARIQSGGTIDEVRYDRFSPVALRLSDPVTASSNTIVVSELGRALPENIGIIRINDEYIGYRIKRPVSRVQDINAHFQSLPSFDSQTREREFETSQCIELAGLTRGLFGSRPAEHGAGNWAHPVRGIPAAIPAGNVGPAENRIGLVLPEYQSVLIQHPGLPFRPLDMLGTEPSPLYLRPDRFGFMRVETGGDTDESTVELFGYNRTERDGDLWNYITGEYRESGQGPLFRGAYGTRPGELTASGSRASVVTPFFVREPDFYPAWMRHNPEQPGTASPEIAYIQGGETFPNATPTKIRWMMDDNGNPELRNAMSARLYLRFDGAPDWSAAANTRRRTPTTGNQPTTTPTGPQLHAWDFTWSSRSDTTTITPASMMEIDISSLVNRPVHRIEWRVHIFHQDSAYETGNWKGSLRFRGLTVELENETRIVAHEELR